MGLKRYLRGLGIGVVVTALIISISTNRKTNDITDDEIKARASELGMIMETSDGTMDQLVEEELENETPTPAEEYVEETSEDVMEESIEEEFIEEETVGFVFLTIRSGESSNEVAEELEKLGVVDDALAFDTYLCANEFATRIHVGDHEIPIGLSYEEIANILCSSE